MEKQYLHRYNGYQHRVFKVVRETKTQYVCWEMVPESLNRRRSTQDVKVTKTSLKLVGTAHGYCQWATAEEVAQALAAQKIEDAKQHAKRAKQKEEVEARRQAARDVLAGAEHREVDATLGLSSVAVDVNGGHIVYVYSVDGDSLAITIWRTMGSGIHVASTRWRLYDGREMVELSVEEALARCLASEM